MKVVAAEVVEKYGDVGDYTPFTVALILGGAQVVAGHVVVVSDFAVVRAVLIDGSVPFVANATFGGVVVGLLLTTTERSRFDVPLKMLNIFRFPPDELVDELKYCVFTRKKSELVVICLHGGAEES